MQINLLPFVIEAFGYNKRIYKDIDKLYQTNKYKFYKAAKEHELYTHQIATEGGLLQEEYCKKSLGILLCAAESEEIAKALSDIIRKGWTYAYLFIENHAEIDLEKFLKNAIRKAGGIDKVTDDWLNTQLLIVFFLSVNAKKTVINNDLRKTFEGMLIDRWQHYRDDEPTRISLKNANIAKIRELKNKIYAEYGHFTNYITMYSKLSRRAETIALLYDYENLSFPSIIENVKFVEKDIEEILLAYQSRNDIDDIKAAADFLCDAMYVKYMAKAYKEVKQRYFENNKETMYVELEGLEKEVTQAKQEVAKLSMALSESQKSLGILEKENNRLKAELAEEKKNRQELNSLREFLFSLDQQEEYSGPEEYSLEELKGFKAVFIGGHEKWQSRMKELLPGFVFIHPDNKAFDTRLLDNVSTIFIYANYLNHAIYYKVMEVIENRGIKVAYIKQQNEKMVLTDIYNAMKGED